MYPDSFANFVPTNIAVNREEGCLGSKVNASQLEICTDDSNIRHVSFMDDKDFEQDGNRVQTSNLIYYQII